MKKCKDCGGVKPFKDFIPHSGCRDKVRPECRDCTSIRKKATYNPTQQREVTLRKYGLSSETFNAILAGQKGGCAICGSCDDLVVDHDHACCPERQTCGKCVRGILCGFCNRAIGLLGDDVNRIERAAAYVARIGQMDWIRRTAAETCACDAPAGE